MPRRSSAGTTWSWIRTSHGISSRFARIWKRGFYVVARVFAQVADRISRGTSPHGRLCDASFGRSYAIVVVGWDEHGLWYLGPFSGNKGQPLVMTEDDFVAAFQGAVVVTRVVEENAVP